MTVKEFKELFKGDIKFFDYATGKAIGEEFKTEENEPLQELEIANIELDIKANSSVYSIPFAKVFVDIDTKTLKLREAIKTVMMPYYKKWYVVDNESNLLYTNTADFNGAEAKYESNIKDLPVKILNSIVTRIKTSCNGHITFNIINEEDEE